MTQEDFLAWREHPLTKWVFEGCFAAAEANKAAWIDQSWGGGECEPTALIELRARADAYQALPETSYEGWCQANGQEPVYSGD